MEFQSHAGSIEGADKHCSGGKNTSFQSHAGSIEVRPPQSPVRESNRFNPTLVRLRIRRWPQAAPEARVSIPRWFD